VWKTYGEDVCGSKEIAMRLEKKFVEAIDANDNGVNLFEPKNDITPMTIQDVFMNFRPTWKEEEEYDGPFMELVPFAKKILEREIKRASDELLAQSIVENAYATAPDKRVIVLDDNLPWHETIEKYPETIYVVSPKSGNWRVEGVRLKKFSFDLRKKLPEAWGGLRDEQLQKLTGVNDAVFCHRALFLGVAQSKEGAIALAEKALAE
jgi:uncharacterized UPF0160 family protein